MIETIIKTIEQVWDNRSLIEKTEVQDTIREVIELLDKGQIRVAEPMDDGKWKVNAWIKKAVILYFPIQKMEVIEVKPFEFHDKIALKTGFKELGVITGVIYFGNNLGGAIGPTLAGYLFDLSGNYHLAFISGGLTAILAGIFMWLLKPVSSKP